MNSVGADIQITGSTAASVAETPGSLPRGGNNDAAEVAVEGRTPVHGVTGPHSDYVVLVSSDFHEFIISRRAAYVSATIRRMLEGRNNKDMNPWNVNEVLVNYPSAIVSKIAEYLIYKEYYQRTQEEAPGFSVQPGIVLEVLMAAQFLDI